MAELPEIERLREQAIGIGDTIDGRRPRVVRLPDAEQAVRDAVERVNADPETGYTYSEVLAEGEARGYEQAVRECAEALRERATRLDDRHLRDSYRTAATILEQIMLGEQV